MVEHLADSFDSNAALLKGCIIKDGTSVMLVGIHLMLPENGMEAKGNFGKKHSPVDAGVQKCAIQRCSLTRRKVHENDWKWHLQSSFPTGA